MKPSAPRTVSVELVGGPRCGETVLYDGVACPAEIADVFGGGRYVLSSRASHSYPFRPLYDYEPRARTGT